VAVVATLSKGYDLEYIWKQVDHGPVKDAASYYIQASESGGEPLAAGGDRVRKLSVWSAARKLTGNLMTCCSTSARPPTARSSAAPRPAAARPPTSTRSCLPLSRTRPPSASASSALRPSGRPARALSFST